MPCHHSGSGLHLHLTPGISPTTRSNSGLSMHNTDARSCFTYGVSRFTMAVSNLFVDPSISLQHLNLPVSCLGDTRFLFTNTVEQPLSLNMFTSWPFTFPVANCIWSSVVGSWVLCGLIKITNYVGYLLCFAIAIPMILSKVLAALSL